jgi:hypothetical protein
MPHTFRNSNIINTVICAGPGCHKTRIGSDPWFVTVIVRDVFTCQRYTPSRPLGCLEQPVCGQACAVRLFDSYLAGTRCLCACTDAPITDRHPLTAALIGPGVRSTSFTRVLNPGEVPR